MYKNLGGYVELAGLGVLVLAVALAAHHALIQVPIILGAAGIYLGRYLRK